MLHSFVCIPSNKIRIDSCSTNVANFFALIKIDGCCLLRVGVLDRVICTIICIEYYRIFASAPFSIEIHVIGRHLVERVRIASTILIVIPAHECESVQCRLLVVISTRDVCLIVDIVLVIKANTLSTLYCRSGSVYKDTIVIDDIILVAAVADVEIIVSIMNSCIWTAAGPITISNTITVYCISNICFCWKPACIII